MLLRNDKSPCMSLVCRLCNYIGQNQSGAPCHPIRCTADASLHIHSSSGKLSKCCLVLTLEGNKPLGKEILVLPKLRRVFWGTSVGQGFGCTRSPKAAVSMVSSSCVSTDISPLLNCRMLIPPTCPFQTICGAEKMGFATPQGWVCGRGRVFTSGDGRHSWNPHRNIHSPVLARSVRWCKGFLSVVFNAL